MTPLSCSIICDRVKQLFYSSMIQNNTPTTAGQLLVSTTTGGGGWRGVVSVSLYADNCALRHLFAPIYLSNDPPLRDFFPCATETLQFHYRNVALLRFHHKRGDSFCRSSQRFLLIWLNQNIFLCQQNVRHCNSSTIEFPNSLQKLNNCNTLTLE